MTNNESERNINDIQAVPDPSRDIRTGYNGPPPETTNEAKPASPPPPPVKDK
ncbi:hypothetical protein [Gimesia alba]|uniref:hypothetical protein n=1 Tax=Gimesia alba TaxID=2527973 RepID=UPI0018D8B490|nr:hypothetical protein [Gimesia alba]